MGVSCDSQCIHACPCWPFTNGWEATRLDCLFSFLLPIFFFFFWLLFLSPTLFPLLVLSGEKGQDKTGTHRDTEKKKSEMETKETGYVIPHVRITQSEGSLDRVPMQTTKYIGMHAKCGLERSFMNDQQHNKIYSEKKKNKSMHQYHWRVRHALVTRPTQIPPAENMEHIRSLCRWCQIHPQGLSKEQ